MGNTATTRAKTTVTIAGSTIDVVGAESVSGPGYSRSKNMFGEVFENGTFNSKYTMGYHG